MSLNYSSTQVKLMLTMLEMVAQDTSIKFPWDAIAAHLGYASGVSAAATWRPIRAKIRKDGPAANGAGSQGVGTPKKTAAPSKTTPRTTPRKRKAVDNETDDDVEHGDEDDDDDEGDCGTPSPSPVREKRVRKATKKLDEKVVDEVDVSELEKVDEGQDFADTDESSDWAPA